MASLLAAVAPRLATRKKGYRTNAHTTQPLNLEFKDLNNTTLQNNTIFVIIGVFFIIYKVFRLSQGL
jgi:hypothetical protein